MLLNRSLLNRSALPQTRVEWESIFVHCTAIFTKIPLNTWQFAVRCLLVISLSVSLGQLFWLVFPSPVIPAATVATPTIIAQASNNTSINIAQLKSLAVFGKVVDTPKQDQATVMEAQAENTQLNLILVGVMESNDEKAGRAIIASGDKQDIYAVNTALPVGNNVILSKVMNDRVIINNNGKYESLWLYQNNSGAPSIAQTSMRQVSQSQTSQTQVSQPIQAPQYPSARPGPSREIQAPAADSPAMADVSKSLSDVVSMSIYSEQGQVIGYKISPGRDAEKFKSLGLQSGDIVTAINGMPLTNPAKIMEVYKNMGNTTSASLEIRRGGNVITVDVVLQ